jgi:hypothetical protein
MYHDAAGASAGAARRHPPAACFFRKTARAVATAQNDRLPPLASQGGLAAAAAAADELVAAAGTACGAAGECDAAAVAAASCSDPFGRCLGGAAPRFAARIAFAQRQRRSGGREGGAGAYGDSSAQVGRIGRRVRPFEARAGNDGLGRRRGLSFASVSPRGGPWVDGHSGYLPR